MSRSGREETTQSAGKSEDYVPVEEAAQRTGQAGNTIRQWRKRDQIRSREKDGRVLVNWQDILDRGEVGRVTRQALERNIERMAQRLRVPPHPDLIVAAPGGAVTVLELRMMDEGATRTQREGLEEIIVSALEAEGYTVARP